MRSCTGCDELDAWLLMMDSRTKPSWDTPGADHLPGQKARRANPMRSSARPARHDTYMVLAFIGDPISER